MTQTYLLNKQQVFCFTELLLVFFHDLLVFRAKKKKRKETDCQISTQTSLSFLSITTVVFHRSHYTTISKKVGMHKIRCEVKNMKNMLVSALLCYAYCVMGCSLGKKISHLLVFSIPHRVDRTIQIYQWTYTEFIVLFCNLVSQY